MQPGSDEKQFCFDDWMGNNYDVFITLYSFVMNSPIVLPFSNIVINFFKNVVD